MFAFLFSIVFVGYYIGFSVEAEAAISLSFYSFSILNEVLEIHFFLLFFDFWKNMSWF